MSLLCISLSISCGQSSTSIDDTVIHLLQELPHINQDEFREYFMTMEEAMILTSDESSPLDNHLRQKWRQDLSGKVLEEMTEHNREYLLRQIKLFQSQGLNLSALKCTKFYEKLDSGVLEREQRISDGQNTYEIRIDYVRHNGRIFIVELDKLKCISCTSKNNQ